MNTITVTRYGADYAGHHGDAMTDPYMTRVGTRRRAEPVASYRELLRQPTRYQRDDGRMLVHAGPSEPTCPDCQRGTLRWAEAGYVPWHRVCTCCGSHWELRPVTYYLTGDGELRVTGPDGLLAAPVGCAGREGPPHGVFLALLTDEMVAEAIEEQRRAGPCSLGSIPCAWARRARFYGGR